MNKRIFLILSIALIAAGTVAGFFAVNDTAKLTAFAVTEFGAGLACASIWKDRKETAKKPLVVLAMVCTGIGAFLAGITNAITESQMTTIIGLILSLLLVIMGIISLGFANKRNE